MLNLIVIDLESTSTGQQEINYQREIIEIGAVKCYVSNNNWEIGEFFESFVKPQVNPVLTEFIKDLTTIQQKDVSQAKFFPVVLDDFKKWIGSQVFLMSSFGKYDFEQIKADCGLYKQQFPFSCQHCNLKTVIQNKMKLKKAKSCGTLVKDLKIEAELPKHRALNDVKNIIKICQKLQITEKDLQDLVMWY